MDVVRDVDFSPVGGAVAATELCVPTPKISTSVMRIAAAPDLGRLPVRKRVNISNPSVGAYL